MWIVGIITRGGWLPSDSLPIGALNALKVIGLRFIVDFGYSPIENNKGIPNEQMRNVLRKCRIDTSIT
jgi:hypothetical protein